MIRLLDNNMKFFSTERMGRIQLKIATLLLILCFHITAIHATFTCQGTSYAAALRRCPDNGQQRMSSGGNVRILVKDVDNLPNSDVTTLSDPYVKFTAGKVSVSTSFKSNTLNPTWNEYVNIGFLGSATLITVEIWDHDTGIEFGDDLLVKASVRVPYCSTMHANITKLDCGMPFNCESTESLWAMPERQVN